MSKQQVSRREFVQGAATVAAGTALGAPAAAAALDPRKTRSYNENMEYRRLGRSDMMISAVSIGGHWKRIPYERGSDDFKKNRRDVMNACLDHGINFVDACSSGEVRVYTEALKDRRKEIYLGFDWGGARKPEVAASVEKMKQNLDEGLKECGLDYVDVWRITVREHTTFHTVQEIENIMEALEWGKKTGRARATGISTHHRPWLAKAVAKYPQLEVIVTPYAAGTKQKPVGSMFDSFKKHNVGMIGIKPFASGSLFLSRGVPDSPTKAEDDERARMALRYVLSYDGLTCTIPGLITVDQVKNAAAAVKERREFDVAEARRYKEIADNMWRNLPPSYEWLRDWEYV